MIPENPNVIGLDIPYKEGTPGYLNLLHRMFSQFGDIIAHEDNSTNLLFKIDLLTDLIISMVVVDEIQDKLKAYKETRIIENMTARKETGAEDTINAVYQANRDVIGMVSRYTNMYLGVDKKLSVIIEDPVTAIVHQDSDE